MNVCPIWSVHRSVPLNIVTRNTEVPCRMSAGSLGEYRLSQNSSMPTFTKNLVIYYAALLLLKYVLCHAARDLPQRCLNRVLLQTGREKCSWSVKSTQHGPNRNKSEKSQLRLRNIRDIFLKINFVSFILLYYFGELFLCFVLHFELKIVPWSRRRGVTNYILECNLKYIHTTNELT